MSSSLRKFFPNLSPETLEFEEKQFHDKMACLDMMIGDIDKYRQKFPNIPERLLKSYYLEFLDKMDIYRYNLIAPFKHLDDIPKNVLVKIFRYIDFHDLVRFATTNSRLYRHVNSFMFFREKFTWEREHYRYINFCLFEGRYQELVYTCGNPVEENYKNQIVLRRNLNRINPPHNHDLADASSLTVFRYHFKKLYSTYFKMPDSTLYNATIAKSFEKLTDTDRQKYAHASEIAKRYGFMYCFRTINWAVSTGVQPVKWCQESYVKEYVRLVVGKNKVRDKDVVEKGGAEKTKIRDKSISSAGKISASGSKSIVKSDEEDNFSDIVVDSGVKILVDVSTKK